MDESLNVAQEEVFDIDTPMSNTPLVPDRPAKDMAFHASSILADVHGKLQQATADAGEAITQYQTQKYSNIYSDLRTEGRSADLEDASSLLDNETQQETHDTLTSIITDPSIPNEHKKNAVLSVTQSLDKESLRNRYLRKSATEDHSLTQEDRDTQDYLVNDFQKRKDDAAKWQFLTKNALEKLNMSVYRQESMGSVAGAFVADMFLPGTASARYAALSEKVHPEGIKGIAQDMLFSGTNQAELGKKWNALSDAEKAELAPAVIAQIAEMPGTDWHKYSMIKDVFENPDQHWAWTALGDVASMAEATLLGATVSGAVRGIRNIANMAKFAKESMKVNAASDAISGEYIPRKPTKPTTGKGAASPEDVAAMKAKVVTPEESTAVALVSPRVPPNSTLGIVSKINPEKGTKARVEAILDDTGQVADAMGARRGEIVAETLPKAAKFTEEMVPDVYEKLRKADEYLNANYNNDKLDPFLVDMASREKEAAVIHDVMKQAHGVVYQQANSTLEHTIDSAYGTATFGRTDEHGWLTQEAAQTAMKGLLKSLPTAKRNNIRVVGKNGQFYIEHDHVRKFDLDEYVLGTQSVHADIYPIPFSDFSVNTDRLARSILGPWVFPPVNMMPTWVTHGGSSVGRIAAKSDVAMNNVIKNEIMSTGPKKELYIALRDVQDGGDWLDYQTLKAQNNHLNKKEMDSLWNGYQHYELVTNHQHRALNQIDKKQLLADDQKAIYDDKDNLLGYGKPIEPEALGDVRHVWDMSTDEPIQLNRKADGSLDLQGRQLVKFRKHLNATADEIKPISDPNGVQLYTTRASDNIFEYGIVGGRTSLQGLPEITFPKIEAYAPVINLENHYIKIVPKRVRINGSERMLSDLKDTEQYAKTVAAEADRATAELTRARLEKEFPDHHVIVAQEREDAATAVFSDYKVYQQHIAQSKKRGERLPSSNFTGKSRIEDPVQALSQRARSIARMGAWQDYQDVFKDQFVKGFGKLLNKGQFPTVKTDILRPTVDTKENIDMFHAAHRMFEQYTRSNYQVLQSDLAWKTVMHVAGDTLESLKLQKGSEAFRELAKQGNMLVKLPSSIASAMYLNMNPTRQWIVQLQQQWVWSAMDPRYITYGAPNLVPFTMALLAKASDVGQHAGAMHSTARALSTMKADEFDAIVEAMHKSGIPQTVDLNMMLHGIIGNSNYALDPGAVKQMSDITRQMITLPSSLGKAVGYGPAELSNTIGTWLFARQRWIDANPGQNWNTPHNIEKISGQAWELSGSMSTEAGAMVYEKGTLGLAFRFLSIGQKQVMQAFSSKLLTPAERGKLVASNMILFGVYGTPFYAAVDAAMNQIDDPEVTANYQQYKGAVMNLVGNEAMSAMFEESGEKRFNLDFSGSMSPFPGIHPVIDVATNMVKLITTDEPARFATVNATGAVWEMVKDISANFIANDYNTPEAMLMMLGEYAELSSGYNNVMHAITMKDIGDKSNKMGNKLGIETGIKEAIAQVGGIKTMEEAATWTALDIIKGEKQLVDHHIKRIVDHMKKSREDYKEDSYFQRVETMKKINGITPEKLRNRVLEGAMQEMSKTGKTPRDNIFLYMLQHNNAGSSEKVDKLKGIMQSRTDKGSEQMMELLNVLEEKK